MLTWQWTGAAGMGVTGIAGALQEAGDQQEGSLGLEEGWLRTYVVAIVCTYVYVLQKATLGLNMYYRYIYI